MKTAALCGLALAIAACGGQAEMAPPADAAPAPAAGGAPLRLIAPLSMTSVTQQRPTLRWVMPDRSTPVVDLCADRSCARPLAIATQLAGDRKSAVPTAALPPGWVYWRVRATSGAEVTVSRTWQFWVGRSSATEPVDTSNPVVLDVNGDGYPDFVVGAPDVNAAHLYLGSPTASATSWNGNTAAARIDLVSFDGPLAQFGLSVASVGDLNGDGYGDFVINAPGALAVHVYFGSATPSDRTWNGLTASERVDLKSPASFFGTAIAGAGDVNGDGYADFLAAGTFSEGYENLGEVWLFLGGPQPSAADWNQDKSTTRVQIITPEADEDVAFNNFGATLAGIGDIDGDGYADFLVGEPGGQKVYLYRGAAVFNEASFNDVNDAAPTQRVALTSPGGTGAYGTSIAAAGDVNGDGHADFLIGGYLMPSPGIALLYFGSAALATSGAGPSSATQPIMLRGADPNAEFGRAIACAGDVNGDGYADFLIGAANSAAAGSTNLYLGSATPQAADWNGTASATHIVLAIADGGATHFGNSVTSVGDVNGDGFDDFVIGADASVFNPPSTEGAAHLYFGGSVLHAAEWSAASSQRRIDLSGPDGAGAHFGRAVAARLARPLACRVGRG